MLTVQETTEWEVPTPNHKYILSNDKRWMIGYYRFDDRRPTIFPVPRKFDAKGRTFDVLIKTYDLID